MATKGQVRRSWRGNKEVHFLWESPLMAFLLVLLVGAIAMWI